MHGDKRRGTGSASCLPFHLPAPSLCWGSAGSVAKNSACKPLARREPQHSPIRFPPAPKASAKRHVLTAMRSDVHQETTREVQSRRTRVVVFTPAVKIARLRSRLSATSASGAGWPEAAHCRGARGRAGEPSKVPVTPMLPDVPAPSLLLLLSRSRAESGKETCASVSSLCPYY